MWEEILQAALPALINAAGSYVSNSGTAAANDRARGENNAFTAEQNQLSRQGEMDRLMAQIAAEKAGAGAKLKLGYAQNKQTAFEHALNAMLTGSQNMHGAANTLLSGWTLPARA